MRNYTENCRSSESLSKMTSQIEYKNWHNFGSRFDFDLRRVSLNAIKFHKIRCRSRSAVPLERRENALPSREFALYY